MNSALSAIGRWFEKGDFTSRDVAIYRIVFAGVMLLAFPQFRWAAEYPQTFFTPPWGPYRLLDGFPPIELLSAMEILLAMALVAVLIGFFTRTASVAVTVVAIVGLGFSYSLGKVDHTAYLMVAPLFLAFTDWGGSLSVDAVIRRRRGAIEATSTPQWPIRLYAVATASAMLTAALPKVSNGWLSTGSSATYASLIGEYFGNDRTAWLAGFFVRFDNPVFWEALDWLTVIAEAALIVLLFSWRSWRVGIAVLCLFHVGVLLTLNIAFWQNIVGYGAFVLWRRASALPSHRTRDRTAASGALPVLAAPVAVVAGGFAAWWAITAMGPATDWLGPVIVLAAGAIASGYLIAMAVLFVRRLVNRRSAATPA
jgi:hypothetical protein